MEGQSCSAFYFLLPYLMIHAVSINISLKGCYLPAYLFKLF